MTGRRTVHPKLPEEKPCALTVPKLGQKLTEKKRNDTELFFLFEQCETHKKKILKRGSTQTVKSSKEKAHDKIKTLWQIFIYICLLNIQDGNLGMFMQ